jgi:hypothetical protein
VPLVQYRRAGVQLPLLVHAADRVIPHAPIVPRRPRAVIALLPVRVLGPVTDPHPDQAPLAIPSPGPALALSLPPGRDRRARQAQAPRWRTRPGLRDRPATQFTAAQAPRPARGTRGQPCAGSRDAAPANTMHTAARYPRPTGMVDNERPASLFCR